jgi:hypothetical protein
MTFDELLKGKRPMDVPGIDLDALPHDYHYGVCNAGVNPNEMASGLVILAKGGERKGKGSYSSYSKFVGFTIATLVFTPYSYFKRGRTTKSQKLIFSEDYSTFMFK